MYTGLGCDWTVFHQESRSRLTVQHDLERLLQRPFLKSKYRTGSTVLQRSLWRHFDFESGVWLYDNSSNIHVLRSQRSFAINKIHTVFHYGHRHHHEEIISFKGSTTT